MGAGMMNRGIRVFAAAALLLAAVGVSAADYPSRPIQVVVPYPAGGSTALAARIVTDSMSRTLNTPIVILNRPGASGFIGSAVVARSAPDGYTFLFAGNGIASAPSLKDVNFDLRKDLLPISKVVASQFSILVNASMPVKNLRELIAYGKANPGKLNVACSGAMTAAQLFDATSRAVPELPSAIRRGDFAPLLGWLRREVHGRASLLETDDLLTAATGRPLDPAGDVALQKKSLRNDTPEPASETPVRCPNQPEQSMSLSGTALRR